MAIFIKEGIHEIFEVNKNDKDYIVDEIARSVRMSSELANLRSEILN